MSADALLQFLTQALYFGIFIAVVVRVVRDRTRTSFDAALFFGVLAIIVAQQWLTELRVLTPSELGTDVVSSLLMALPYLTLRLVDDVADVARPVMRVTELGLAASIAAIVTISGTLPIGVALPMVLYFVAVEALAVVKVVQQARRSGGVTRRRMYAVATGSALLAGVIFIAGLQLVVPSMQDVWRVLSQFSGLASGLAYYVGFAPPAWLRRAWQEPELRAFLSRAASLPRLPDTASIVRELERGAAASLGAPRAAVDLWDSASDQFRFSWVDQSKGGAPGKTVALRVFSRQRAELSDDVQRSDPSHEALYQQLGVRAVLAAPITAGERRLGVLTVFAPRAPIFAEEDLVLVQLLADQAAVILESRALIDEAARVRAREEATRLKDDFLSAAAHDLKTPLTTLVAQAQLLERRARRQPAAPADLNGIERIVRESIRLRNLVLELLDASRAEQGLLVGAREPINLVDVARESCERHADRTCTLEAEGEIVAAVDRTRIVQLLDNLIENAIKYSPEPEPVLVRVWREGEEARIDVQDRGIGIPASDLPRIFDRFFRAGNVDDRRFAGMGLGLYICHGIVAQHGGRMWVDSVTETNGSHSGTTFHVALPLVTGEATSPQAGRQLGVETR